MNRRTGINAQKNTTKKGSLAPKSKQSDLSVAKNSSLNEVLNLQKTAGNQAVKGLFDAGKIQPKLTIGQPGDKYELEADRMAEQVMRMPDTVCPTCVDEKEEEEVVLRESLPSEESSFVQRQVGEEEEKKKKEEPIQTKLISARITPLVQKQVEDVEKKKREKEMFQAKENSGGLSVTADIDSSINRLRGKGEPLSESVKNYFEPRFGYDFSGVKVHTGSEAAYTAKSINAHAFAVGNDVVFGANNYSPETGEGKKLLAHELTHVVQQGIAVHKNEIPGNSDSVLKKSLGEEKNKVSANGLLIKKRTEEQPCINQAPLVEKLAVTSVEESTPTIYRSYYGQSRDRELIDLAIKDKNVMAVHLINNYRNATRDERYKLIDILTDQVWVGPFDEWKIEKIWDSFDDKIIEAASTEKGLSLWKKSVEKGAELLSIDFVKKFISSFEKEAKKVAYNSLQESEQRVDAVRKKYGITEKQIEKTVIETTGMDKGKLWERKTVTYTEYKMPQSEKSEALARAAKGLLDKRAEVNSLKTRKSALVKNECGTFTRGFVKETFCYPKITDPKKYKLLEDQIRDESIEYSKLLNKTTEDFPELAPIGISEDRRLATVAEGEENKIAQIIGPMMKEVLTNILTSREGLNNGKLSIWHLDIIIGLTKAKMNVESGLFGTIVDQKKVEVEEDEALIKAFLSILAGVLAIIAAIPSGGSSLILLGTSAALGASIGISAGLISEEMEQFNLMMAANASDFVKAKALSSKEPSLFWLAIDLIMFGVDIFGAAKIFKGLMETAKTAALVGRTAGEGGELLLRNADEAVEVLRKGGNEIAEGLGDRMAKDAIEARGSIWKRIGTPFKALNEAKEWAESTLRLSKATLKDLSLEAINRLRTLPDWMLDRLRQFSSAVKRFILGCSSSCKVDIEKIKAFLEKHKAEKVETIEEFLARGGKIQKLPPAPGPSRIADELEELFIGSSGKSMHGSDPVLRNLLAVKGTFTHQTFNKLVNRLKSVMPKETLFLTEDWKSLEKILGGKLPWKHGKGPDLILVDRATKKIAIIDLTRKSRPSHIKKTMDYADEFRKSFPDWTVPPDLVKDIFYKGSKSIGEILDQQLKPVLAIFGG
jgi:hypothetical protein